MYVKRRGATPREERFFEDRRALAQLVQQAKRHFGPWEIKMKEAGKKRYKGRAALTAVLAIAGFVVSASAIAQSAPTTGIVASKHNLSSTASGSDYGGPADRNRFGGTDEICVFCHTPHGSSASTAGPLWNRVAPTTTGYTPYRSATMDAYGAGAGETGSPTYGPQSLACLSCHDGSQALNTVINAPGSGNWDSTNGVTMSGTWTAYTGSALNTTTGKLSAGGVAALGTDLSNDHPIGIAYCGGRSTATRTSNTDCRDGDFNGVSGTAAPFWVDVVGGVAASREKTDIALFGANQMVECASCHDPHSTNSLFLRTANTNSRVCLACHNK